MSQPKSKATFASVERAARDNAASRLDRLAREMRSFDADSVQSRPDERASIFQRRVNELLSDLVGMGSGKAHELTDIPHLVHLEGGAGRQREHPLGQAFRDRQAP